MTPFHVHLADQVQAALAAAHPRALSAAQIQVEVAYGMRYLKTIRVLLAELAADGAVEKITPPGTRPAFWRHTAPVTCLPPLTVRSDLDGGRP
jgi:hypothetical protein